MTLDSAVKNTKGAGLYSTLMEKRVLQTAHPFFISPWAPLPQPFAFIAFII